MSQRLRLRKWVLGAHGVVAGFGFFAIGLPVALVLASHPDVEDALRSSVAPLSGSAVVPFLVGALPVAAFYAVPLFWPFHLAVGLYEVGLVGRVGRGDRAARRSARRALDVQGGVFIVLAVAVAAWFRFRWLAPALFPVAWGGAHLLLGWWIATEERTIGSA